ncbi:hypothetical protein [Oryza sativa Japonica Group]|uniref:Uncharacterized protein n=1 Tax=Oryza sativa subsp. japonica TaxID=39947 RepID=Q5JKG9_ORYSJ|nr:hypothetical protein [Oryza sativa Japonica Group]
MRRPAAVWGEREIEVGEREREGGGGGSHPRDAAAAEAATTTPARYDGGVGEGMP